MTAGSVNEAKGYLKQAISADPNKGAAHCELGDIYWKKENDIDKAVAEYRLAISAEPTVPDAYEDLATALEAKGQKEEAIEVWGKALVYTDDSMKKEKIKEHIDLLEKGPASSASPSVEQRPEAISREQTKDLEREVRQQKPSETRRIETAPVNVGSDFQDVKEDTATIDLAKEAKKRAKEKKAGQ
jgi:tetratricopeptide (TPR) repeat protein